MELVTQTTSGANLYYKLDLGKEQDQIRIEDLKTIVFSS